MLFQKGLLKIVNLVILSLFLISCQPTHSPAQPITQENEIRDIHVQMAEPSKATADVEQFPLPNCGGTDKLGQSLGMYASITKNVTVGGKATITGGGEVAIPETAKLKLEIQVELAYQQAYESANSRLDSIDMSAAPGTHVVYTIVWEEQVFSSIVQYSADGQVHSAPYTYKLRIPKIDKSYNVECSEGVAKENPPLSPASTPIPPISTTSVEVQLLGLWEYQKPRAPMPAPAGQNQVIMANGDIDTSGTCHIKVFGPGETVQGLGEGTFQLWVISGTSAQIEEEITRIQNGAAAHAGGSCPRKS